MGILTAFTEIKMSFLTTFGPACHWQKQKSNAEKIIAGDHKTPGTITAVKTCWWIKVRGHTSASVKFPHIIHFTYRVNGRTYQGIKCVSFYMRRPNMNETITVFYDETFPTRTAAILEPISLLY